MKRIQHYQYSLTGLGDKETEIAVGDVSMIIRSAGREAEDRLMEADTRWS
jgi:hypothetical protein